MEEKRRSARESSESRPLDPFRELTIKDLQRGWDGVATEHDYVIEASDIGGRLDPDLQGSVFRTGPGIDSVYATKLVHPIDGDGLVCAISFAGDGRAHFQSRFVSTAHRAHEQREHRLIYRGQMGTLSGHWLREAAALAWSVLRCRGLEFKMRNPSNTNVFYWEGKLLSCYETSLPYSLDPFTLQTIGPDDLNGAARTGTFGAHFRIDAARNRLVTFGLKFTLPGMPSVLEICEFGAGWKLLQKQEHRIPGLNYVHDFLLTERFYVLHMTPFVKISVGIGLKILSGWTAPGETMRYYPDLPSRFVVLSRDPASKLPPLLIETDPLHIFHFINGWESSAKPPTASAATASATAAPTTSKAEPQSSGQRQQEQPRQQQGQRGPEPCPTIEFSAVCIGTGFNMEFEQGIWLSNASQAPGQICSFSLDLVRRTCSRVCSDSASVEFPTMHPDMHGRPTRFSYLMASDSKHPKRNGANVPYRDVLKFDATGQTRQAWHSDGVVGEPIFIPRPRPKPAPTPGKSQPQPQKQKSEEQAQRASASPGSAAARSESKRAPQRQQQKQPQQPSKEQQFDPAEDDGWVFVQVFMPEERVTHFAVLDAKHVDRGPTARIRLKHHLTHGFHGTFAPCPKD